MSQPDDSLIGARLTYVWDWWKFHAEQRTNMFNYFLIITGILANAYVALRQRPDPAFGRGLAAVGLITSIGFVLLDARNRQQLDRAQRLLESHIEPDLFEDGVRLASIKGPLLLRHRTVFFAIEGLIALGWLLLLLRM